MAAISSNPIAASDGPAPALVRAAAQDADKSAGGQTFMDLLTGKSRQTPADSISGHASAGTKPTGSPTSNSAHGTVDTAKTTEATKASTTASAKNPAVASKPAAKNEKKAQAGQDQQAGSENTRQAKQPPQLIQAIAVAAAAATKPSSTAAAAPTVHDDDIKKAPPPDIATNGKDTATVPTPPNSGGPTANPKAKAGDNNQKPAQNPVQAGKNSTGEGSSTTATDSQSAPNSTKAAAVLSNLKPVADTATAQAQTALADTAQKSGSVATAVPAATDAPAATVATVPNSDTENAGTSPDAAVEKSQSRKKPKNDPGKSSEVVSSASSLSQATNAQTPAPRQPATGDDYPAPPTTDVRPAPVSAAPQSAAAHAFQNQVAASLKEPIGSESSPNTGQVPPEATQPKDKTVPSGKVPQQTGAPQPAPGAAIKAMTTAMAGAQPLTGTAAHSNTAGQTSSAQSVAPSHDNGNKPAHVAQPQAAAAAQPISPTSASIHSAAVSQPGALQPAAASLSGGTSAPGANPPAIGLAAHIAPTAGMPTPNLDVLAISIAARSLSGAKQFDIRLDPPELGSVQVRLSIDASGKTQAHMTADQPQTLTLLQKDAPTLTQALRDAGLNVSQQGLNFSLRGQDRQNDSRNGGGPGRRTNLSVIPIISTSPAPMPVSRYGAASNARVDIHV